MNGWILALIYFGVGLLGVLIGVSVKQKSKLFLWAVLLAGAAFVCRYAQKRVSFASTLGLIWGGLVLLCTGMTVVWLIRCRFSGKSRRDASARRKGTNSGRMTKAMRRKMMTRALVVIPLCLALSTGIVMGYTSLGSMGGAGGSSAGGSGVLDNSIATKASLRSKTINILVCGIDNDADDAHQQKMTDVILVASIDLGGKTASLLQIPRDTYVGDVTSTGKINAVYNNASAETDAINTLAKQLNRMFALPLDNYVTITMEGFGKAVDAIGGVEVTLEQEMVFNLRDPNEVVVRTITLPAGPNLLDGEMADLFVRYRDYTRADLDRLNVQRVFLAALMHKMTSLSAMQLLQAVRAVYPYLETDFSFAELAALAMRARGFTAESVTVVRVPGEPAEVRGQSVFSLHEQALADVLNAHMRPYADPVGVDGLDVIEVQNTTGILDNSDAPLSDYDGP